MHFLGQLMASMLHADVELLVGIEPRRQLILTTTADEEDTIGVGA
jgi:hypothetical protein